MIVQPRGVPQSYLTLKWQIWHFFSLWGPFCGSQSQRRAPDDGLVLLLRVIPKISGKTKNFRFTQCSKLPAYDFIVMIFLGKGHKIIKKILYDVDTPEVWKGGYIQHVTSNSPTPKQVFLATAWAQGAHSPAGLQGVNNTLWCLGTPPHYLGL